MSTEEHKRRAMSHSVHKMTNTEGCQVFTHSGSGGMTSGLTNGNSILLHSCSNVTNITRKLIHKIALVECVFLNGSPL